MFPKPSMLHFSRSRWRHRPERPKPPTPGVDERCTAGPRRRSASVIADVERGRLVSERAQLAVSLDAELRALCRTESAARRELGVAAHLLMRGHAYRRLGFVRLSDYARERLGVSARTVQEAAAVASRLDTLPATSTAFDRSEISWTQARLLCRVASTDDEERWLAAARCHRVESLARLVDGIAPDAGTDADPHASDIDGEPSVRWRLACPARVRALWRHALELASRVAGGPLALWWAAEIIAAEGASGRPAGGTMGTRTSCARFPRMEPPARADAIPAAATAARIARSIVETTSLDPFALDARLVAARGVIQTADARIGRLLRVVIDHRFYKLLGVGSVDAYARERLGLSSRKAWALVRLEKACFRGDEFARAYGDGSLSWTRALALLPVLTRDNARAWVARAQAVTVRRLFDEVNHVLESRDLLGPAVSLDPPPIDGSLVSPVTGHVHACGHERELSLANAVQIGARTASAREGTSAAARGAHAEVCDAAVSFTGPVSVVALLRDVLDAFAVPGVPRWVALERLLLHVVTHWESTPRHRDPVFARDGWRCAVPACSSRRNLHDHHLLYRSRGGGNEGANRVAVCAAHHLHAVHTGVIRGWGSAPAQVHWELGVRRQAPPLLAYVGERRVLGDHHFA